MSTLLGTLLTPARVAAAADRPRLFDVLGSRVKLRRSVVPLLDAPVWLRLLGSEEENAIHSAVILEMRRLEIEQLVVNQGTWERAAVTRTLALAALSEESYGAAPAGTVEEWGKLPIECQLAVYHDWISYREEMDPQLEQLSKTDIDEIELAVKKNNSALLLRLGARRLTAYLLTSASTPSDSQTEKSTPGA